MRSMRVVDAARDATECGGFRKRLHSIGVSVSDTRPETRIDDGDRDRELVHQPSDDPAHEQDRE